MPAVRERITRRDGRRGDEVAPQELPRAVTQAVALRQHRQPPAIALHVVAKLRHGGVPAVRIFLQRQHHDVVEFAFEPAPQFSGTTAFRIRRPARVTAALGLIGIALAYGPHHFVRKIAAIVHGMQAGKQFIEKHAQEIDVGRGGDRLSKHLLGAGSIRASISARWQPWRPAAYWRGRPGSWRCRSRAASRCLRV